MKNQNQYAGFSNTAQQQPGRPKPPNVCCVCIAWHCDRNM